MAPGKFVTVSAELAEKAAHVFGLGLTRDQVRAFKVAEPRHATLLVGSTKPLALTRRQAVLATAAEKVSSPTAGPPASQDPQPPVGKAESNVS